MIVSSSWQIYVAEGTGHCDWPSGKSFEVASIELVNVTGSRIRPVAVYFRLIVELNMVRNSVNWIYRIEKGSN